MWAVEIDRPGFTHFSFFAGAQKVAIYSFTIQFKTTGTSDTVKDFKVQYAGDNTADVSRVSLYRESGSIPGTFNAAQDTLLISATSAAAGGEFDRQRERHRRPRHKPNRFYSRPFDRQHRDSCGQFRRGSVAVLPVPVVLLFC